MDLQLFIELYRLWEPVYPHLAKDIREMYGRDDGNVLEVGPFCGTIFELCRNGTGKSFSMGIFPPGMAEFFSGEAERLDLDKRVTMIATDPALAGMEDDSFDLIVFRGALFFPEIFRTDFRAVYRVLRDRGLAVVGGGFGRSTPPAVIEQIGERSKELNMLLGKTGKDEKRLLKDIESCGCGISGSVEILSKGGLWAVIRKE
ncbi:MAG TPA: class I SAM-dependent methyltransferase [Syntrophorhabdaceae bacterium]|nr:class I SAM-dependent methyltransferase [Syntrophorhabdaceae bacterium]HQM81793.1 class I SAM-dependent methyltransferase [Syntrophorhabdaceae bacterium]